MPLKSEEQLRAELSPRLRIKNPYIKDDKPQREKSAGLAMTSEEVCAWVFVNSVWLHVDRGILFDPKLKSPVKESGLREWLSDRAGVYFVSLLEENDFCKPVYIGMSGNSVSKRLSSGHHAIAEIMSRPDYQSKLFCIHVIEPPINMPIRVVEAAAISRWEPVLNKEKTFPSADLVEAYLREVKESINSHSFL